MWWEYVASGVSALGDWVSDTFGSGSRNSKLTAQLNATIEQQNALVASYENTISKLTSKTGVLPWVIGGVALVGGIYFLTRKSIAR